MYLLERNVKSVPIQPYEKSDSLSCIKPIGLIFQTLLQYQVMLLLLLF